MRLSRLTLASAALLAVASASLLTGRSHVFAASHAAAQDAPPPPPQGPPPGAPPAGGPPPGFTMPAPTNLKVLPRNLTGAQVHEIMEKWSGELGAHCNTCHAADKNPGPNGRPRMNFADDSKEEKQTARKMFQMTEDINVNYVSKIDSSGEPVTCGTCHRGHLGPEPFVPKSDHDHDHPPAPPAGAKPPTGR